MHANLPARTLRVLAMSVLLVLVLPVLVTVSLALRLTAGGPVLERLPDRARSRRSLRFRTRRNDDPSRLTTLGRLLERTRLVELPVLIDLLWIDGVQGRRSRAG